MSQAKTKDNDIKSPDSVWSGQRHLLLRKYHIQVAKECGLQILSQFVNALSIVLPYYL